MKKALLLLLLPLTLCSCASFSQSTGNPMADAANGLIETKHGIIAAAKTMDVLCQQAVVPPEPCMKAKALYDNEIPKAYLAASDALVLAVASGNLADYTIQNQALLNSLGSLTALIQAFQPKGATP